MQCEDKVETEHSLAKVHKVCRLIGIIVKKMCIRDRNSGVESESGIDARGGAVAQDRAKEGVRLPYVLRHFDVSYLGICAPVSYTHLACE